ncbi:MAG: DUF6178 family protein [Desulfosalsimonadaceae bacterium]
MKPMDMDAKTEEKRLAEIHHRRMASLTADKKRIFAMAPEDALDAILDHPTNRALVHSMAEEDFFFLLNGIGHHDAIDILSLASNRQWEYILDMEAWHRDRMQLERVGYWLNLLHQADPGRFVEWTMQEKYPLLEYYLNRTADIFVREHDEDPSDLGDGFFTCDDVFYIRFSKEAFTGIEEEEDREEMENFLYTLIHRIADEDHMAYQVMLLRAASVIPGESEEEAFRFRNVRLAEKGFLPFDEAVGVYAPVRPEAIQKDPRKRIEKKAAMDFTVPVPINHAVMLQRDTLFGKALAHIDAEEVYNEIQTEFASLCNRIIAADQIPIKEREQLRSVVNKACGYLGMGIQRLAETKAPPEASRSASIISNYSLTDIFRTGYALVLALKKRAEKWQKQSWFAKNRLALAFWGEYLVGHIGGLLLKHPKHFDNYKSGYLYREFAAIDDIREAEAALNEAMIFDRMLSLMDIHTEGLPEQQFVTFHAVLLTLWAKSRIDIPPYDRVEPIPVKSFRPFYRSLWEKGAKTGHIKDSVKSDFLDWLSTSTGFTAHDISLKAASSLENLFAALEDEFADVDEKDLDSRFVTLFLLRK